MKIFRLFVAFTLVCFAFSPSAQAVVPPPDGGYPGGNTAEGQTALLSLTTGSYNTAVGYLSLRSDTTRPVQHGHRRRGTAACEHRGQQYGYRRGGAFSQHYGQQQHRHWR